VDVKDVEQQANKMGGRDTKEQPKEQPKSLPP
jgi:hypothetical protein